mmetsp:Transcript_32854/g.64415  ORF Transcript_32854/g.64415 Transcript_32854/m.64415 type:complete len:85 (+) Transcript_32854:166-420(+)
MTKIIEIVLHHCVVNQHNLMLAFFYNFNAVIGQPCDNWIEGVKIRTAVCSNSNSSSIQCSNRRLTHRASSSHSGMLEYKLKSSS